MSLDVRLPILLRQLRLPSVATHYRRFAQEAAQAGRPYEEYLLALVEQSQPAGREPAQTTGAGGLLPGAAHPG